MSKILWSAVLVLVVVVGGWYWYVHYSPSAVSPALAADLYPLYPGASWGSVETASTTDGVGYTVSSEPFANITDIAKESEPFAAYYDQKLTAAGWIRDMAQEAGGPGAEQSVYTKDDQFVIVSFHSVFHIKPADAPEQCPCDLTLSLMSGTKVSALPDTALSDRTYSDPSGFSIILPTALASAPDVSKYSVDTSYAYEAKGPGDTIPGVKFTIPASLAAGTNLASDTYLSVEKLPEGQTCDAATFLSDPHAVSHIVQEGAVAYSVASSSDAGAGNRYEETVYARTGSNPCVAVRYFVHYAAIENFPEGAVSAFDKPALLAAFDQIRRTLRIPQ